VEERCGELTQEAPNSRARQAAAGKRGESSNSSMSGSSNKIINR
jgi:hypothetical protein